MSEPIQTRDEPAGVVRTRLQQLGVYDDLAKLAGWQRTLIYDSLEAAHKLDLSDHDTLAGARHLQEMADTYGYTRTTESDRLVVSVLERAATSYVHVS